jgi:competence protein ComGC
MKNEKGFTLIEMLVVLLIISVLILISVPNIAKHFANVDQKGCEAYVKMVEGQVEAFKMENHYYPLEKDLIEKGYIKGSLSCPNGDRIELSYGGKIKVIKSTGEAASEGDGSDS